MKSLAFWLGLFLFSVYLLTFSGKLHVMDEFVGYAAGNNWVQHGRADVNQFIWTNHWHSTPPGVWGTDNNLYTKKAPGISLAAAPLIWVGHTIPGLNAVHLSLLLSAIITAATGSLLFIWLVDLEISPFVAVLTALVYGLATIALVYARFLWEHSVMALAFLVAMWALYRAVHVPRTQYRWGWVFLCSVAMSAAFLMRFEAAMGVAFVGAYLFLYAAPLPQRLSPGKIIQLIKEKTRWQWAIIYGLLPALTVGGLLYFNLVRFGAVSETGYNREILFQRPWEGALGLLFSPSTGLFIYVPVMLLIFFGMRPTWRRLPHPYFWLMMLLTLFYWLFYGSWFSWGSTWVWGPRFLLHTLPLLMVFVAEVLEWLRNPANGNATVRKFAWGGVVALVLAGFVINFLGIVVDLNEHFLRLGRNDNYVFNWSAFPPLGHLQILLEGQTDFIWLPFSNRGEIGINWQIAIPALTLLFLAAAGLGFSAWSTFRAARHGLQITRHPLTIFVSLVAAIGLVYAMMLGTAQAALVEEQAQADAPVLQTLATTAHNFDSLLIPMPPFGDVQETSERMMAYLHKPLPTYVWIESEPRAIQPDERERIWQAVNAQSGRVWLFERWLTPNDPLGTTAIRLNQAAFPVQEQWVENSGKLSLYALPGVANPVPPTPLNVPFEGGLTLVDFAVLESVVSPGDILKVRLTWQAPQVEKESDFILPRGGLVGFVHLPDMPENGGGNVAQHDRLLLDFQRPHQSPLLPGQIVSQGYGLQLPNDLSPGSYPLVAGLYSAATGQRLHRSDDSPDNFLYLTNITAR